MRGATVDAAMGAQIGGCIGALTTGDMGMYTGEASAGGAPSGEEAALLRCDAWIPDPIVAVVARDATSFDYTPRALTQQAVPLRHDVSASNLLGHKALER
jgi:hypothetical protein